MKYRNLLKSKRGFTLVELVVSMAIMAILGLGSVGLLMMVSGIYKDTSSTTQLKTTTNSIIDYIKTYVDTSEYVEILDAAPSDFSKDFARIKTDTPDNRKDLFAEINAGYKKVGYMFFHSANSGQVGGLPDDKNDLYISYPGVDQFTSLGVNGLYGSGYNYNVFFSTARYSNSSAEGLVSFGNPVGNVLHVTVEVTNDAGNKVFNYQTNIYLYNVFEDDVSTGVVKIDPETGKDVVDDDGNPVYETVKVSSLVDRSTAPLSTYAQDFNTKITTEGIMGRSVTEGKCIRFVSNLPSDN